MPGKAKFRTLLPLIPCLENQIAPIKTSLPATGARKPAPKAKRSWRWVKTPGTYMVPSTRTGGYFHVGVVSGCLGPSVFLDVKAVYIPMRHCCASVLLMCHPPFVNLHVSMLHVISKQSIHCVSASSQFTYFPTKTQKKSNH